MTNPKLKILLGLTGSVATTLYKKIILSLQEKYDVDVILTSASKHFIGGEKSVKEFVGLVPNLYEDDDEWKFDGEVWTKGDRILHIELRDQYSAFVIAPCSANTLAKIASGICDNLLTSVARAWDPCKPLIIAPAMNTEMWNNPVTDENLERFRDHSYKNIVVPPQEKLLACGTTGIGAMAQISNIVFQLNHNLKWKSPFDTDVVQEFSIPVDPHPGAFASHRRGHTHTGVDLYVDEGARVMAMEDGVIVGVEHFTGPLDNSPWWEDTDCVLVRGSSGVINYGEIKPWKWVDGITCGVGIKPGSRVYQGDIIGEVKRVIQKGKEHPEITGWKPSMLHIELYPWNTTKASSGFEKFLLRDPTPFLLESFPNAKRITWEERK